MPRYLTRFKLRQKKSPLMKLAKAAVAAIDGFFEGYELEDDTEILEKVNNYLEEEVQKTQGKRATIMKELKKILKQDEPVETKKEDSEKEKKVKERNEKTDKDETDEEEEIKEDQVCKEEEENSEEVENMVHGEENNEVDFLVKNEMVDSFQNIIGNMFPRQNTEEKVYFEVEVSLADPLANQSVTARDGTFNDLLKDFVPSRSNRSTSLSDLGSKKSHSLTSLLTAVPPTPVPSVISVSKQPMFVEDISGRARSSSQDLTYYQLFGNKVSSPFGPVGTPISNCGTPNSVDSSVICLGSFYKNPGFVTPTAADDSVICLGTVKKPKPPLNVTETPHRRRTFSTEQTTPQQPTEFLKARASLRRVPDSPMEKEMKEVATESIKDSTSGGDTNDRHDTVVDVSSIQAVTTDRLFANMRSPIYGGTTDRHVTDMEISPMLMGTTDRHVTNMDISPIQALTTDRLFGNMDSPIYGGPTDRHVTDMEISPMLAGTTDRHVTDMEISPDGKSSSSELDDLPVITPKPRPRLRRMTPFPQDLVWKK